MIGQGDDRNIMRSLFDRMLEVDERDRTRELSRIAETEGLAEDVIEEVRSLLAFVDATRVDGASNVDDDDPADLVGCRLGVFMLESLVGVGGTAAVFSATQDRPNRRVAVKVLRETIAGPRARRRFEREIEIAGRLDHPGIARVYDSGRLLNDGIETPWLAMEFVDRARTITGYANSEDLDVRGRVGLMRQALSALVAAHRRGVIHRDLKPGNILVDGDGRVRVIDFGIARQSNAAVARGMTATMPGQLVGTLPFMAPEQLDGQNDHVDVRTDVYALGVTTHLLLTGRMPYQTSDVSFVDLAQRIRDREIGSLRRITSSIDRDLDGIVQKALAKDPESRYQSAEAFDDDLEAWLDGRPVTARPLGRGARAWRLARRHPVQAGSIVATAVALFAAVGILSIMLARENNLRIRGDRATADAAIAATKAAFDRADLGSAHRHLVSVPESERGWEYDWLSRLVDLGGTTITLLGGDVIDTDIIPATSERGERLIMTAYRGTWAYDLSDNTPVWHLPELEPEGSWKHAFLPPGDRLAVCGLAPGLVVVDVEDGSVIARMDTSARIGVMWGVDERRILLGGDDGGLELVDVPSGNVEKRFHPQAGTITSILGMTDGRILIGTSNGSLLVTDEDLDQVDLAASFPSKIPRMRADADERRLAICLTGDRVDVVDARTFEHQATFDDHLADVWDVRFANARNLLVTASMDESVRVFDLATGDRVERFSGPHAYVWSLALTGDERHAWIGCHDGVVRRIALDRPELPSLEHGSITSIAWSPSGDRIAVGTDRGLRFFDPTTSTWIPTGESGAGDRIWDLVWTPNGIWFASGDDRSLHRHVNHLSSDPIDGVSNVVVIDERVDGGVLVGLGDGSLRSVLPDGTALAPMHAGMAVQSLAMSPHGDRAFALFVGRNADGVVVDLVANKILKEFEGYGHGPTFDFTVSPDGTRIAAGGRERPESVVNFPIERVGEQIQRIGHSGDVRHVEFLDDGRRIVSAADDGRVIIGRPSDSQPIITLFEAESPILDLAVSKDGSSLAATDGTVLFIASGRSDRE